MMSSADNMPSSTSPFQLPCPSSSALVDRRWKPNVELAPNCPRCDSSNTKFCYYNNYSLTQPRYFCKGCRRYWTKGGSLRNVPVGGGCRKNRRGKPLRLSAADRSRGDSLGSSSSPSSDCGRGQHHLQVRPDSMRHDVMSGGSGTSADTSRSDGSDIDLAVLYSRFLNQCPEFDPAGYSMAELPLEFDEQFDFTSSFQPVVQLPQEIPAATGATATATNDVFLATDTTQLADFDFSFDSGGCDVVDGDGFWLNFPVVQGSIWQSAATALNPDQFMPAAADDGMALHQNILSTNWSSVIDPSSFEALTRP